MSPLKYPSFVIPLLIITLTSMRSGIIVAEARNLLDITFPDFPKPELPSLPEIPKPELPALPELPKPELPSFPEIPKPELPALPELPKPELPAFPEIPKPELPHFPSLEVPALPVPKFPTLPNDFPIPSEIP